MKCKRCGREFSNPVPPLGFPNTSEPDYEIACIHWCPDCNRAAMMAVHRGGSAYFMSGNKLSPTYAEGFVSIPREISKRKPSQFHYKRMAEVDRIEAEIVRMILSGDLVDVNPDFTKLAITLGCSESEARLCYQQICKEIDRVITETIAESEVK